MEYAIELAKKAFEIGEVPVGAVVVQRKSGIIVGEGFNRRECDSDPLAHAEVIAIRKAARKLGSWRLSGCDLYVTLEPCAMCCGAIINSRIERVYFGAYDLNAGCVHSMTDMFVMPFNHKPEAYGGIMEQQCAGLLKDFFAGKR
ncbi:MAG: nucleoside deaminase [Oscillospiraceae bacterium]|nr:nucleoside deaminase [Oscillospiraceae bacterium]